MGQPQQNSWAADPSLPLFRSKKVTEVWDPVMDEKAIPQLSFRGKMFWSSQPGLLPFSVRNSWGASLQRTDSESENSTALASFFWIVNSVVLKGVQSLGTLGTSYTQHAHHWLLESNNNFLSKKMELSFMLTQYHPKKHPLHDLEGYPEAATGWTTNHSHHMGWSRLRMPCPKKDSIAIFHDHSLCGCHEPVGVVNSDTRLPLNDVNLRNDPRPQAELRHLGCQRRCCQSHKCPRSPHGSTGSTIKPNNPRWALLLMLRSHKRSFSMFWDARVRTTKPPCIA